MNCKMFLFVAALVLLFVQSAFAQTEELSDTVWTKFTYPASINAVKFTPDGRYLASGGSDGIPRLWDVETGELIKEFQGNGWPILGLDINPSGELLAVVNKISVVTIWNINTGEIIKKLDEYPNQDQGLDYKSIDFSNNGLYLAASIANPYSSSIEPGIFIWSTDTWEVIGKAENLLNPFHLTFSPDDAILAVSNIVDGPDRKTVALYQVPSLKRIGGTEYISTTINQSSFSPDGDYLAGAISPLANKVWKTSDWKLFRNLGQGKDAKAVIFSTDSKYVVTGQIIGGNDWSRLFIFDNESGIEKYSYLLNYYSSNLGHQYGDLARTISVSPDSKQIAVGGSGGIYLLNAKWNPTSVPENPVQITEPLIFPNPANRTVNIRFNLIKPAEVNIAIYDISSIKVAGIYEGFLEPGLQNFEWNISRVPSGTYFARITAHGATSTVKIIVNK